MDGQDKGKTGIRHLPNLSKCAYIYELKKYITTEGHREKACDLCGNFFLKYR